MCTFRQYAAGVAVGLMVFLSGCADRPMSVPASATLMTEGSTRASFRATDHGRVYVTDETDKKIVYQGEVDKGEMVEVNAKDDRILIGGRTVTERALADGHQYRVFFEPLSGERTVRYRVVEEPAR
ncbi:MAG: hypothetical protein JWN40_4025 [Phycisphaerales bacterium]|nr:hypothetical protein [Phycisphaerales bacterium]